MVNNKLPYTDNGNIRTFSEMVNSEELLWHWDGEDRTITPCAETDWRFQFDNERPFNIGSNSIFIKAGVWHRLIKGSGDLVLNITRHI